MVKHIILWKLKDEYNTQEIKNGIKTALEGLLGVVPGLMKIEIQTECLPTSNVDVMLYSVLESEEALKEYAIHPAHVAAADNFVRPYTAIRSCIDFEIKEI